jgi:hypothetical protein
VNFPVKLLFGIPPVIPARFYPGRIFRKFRKALRPRFRSRQPGLTRAVVNLAAKRFPLPDAPETRSVLPSRFPTHQIVALFL